MNLYDRCLRAPIRRSCADRRLRARLHRHGLRSCQVTALAVTGQLGIATAGQIRLTVETAGRGQLAYRSFRIRTPRQFGDAAVVYRLRPLFETFSKKVAHMGGPGAGQASKLINNALLMANQKSIADLLGIAQQLDIDIPALVDELRSGTASSVALQALGTAITLGNAEHLRQMQLVDMDIFAEAVAGLGDSVTSVSRRAIEGAEALPRLAGLVTA